MTDIKELSKKHYDLAIIGSNLTGLLAAYTLNRKYNLNIAIIESKDDAQSSDNYVETGRGRLGGQFTSLPVNEDSLKSLNWLQELLGEELFSETAQKHTALTVDSGQLIPFVGFGDKKFQSMEEINLFATSEVYHLNENIEYLTDRIKNLLLADIYTMAEATDIHIEDGEVTSVTINGAKELKADKYVFALSPKKMGELFKRQPELAGKNLAKISKAKTWTHVEVYFEHSQEFATHSDFHILMGNKTDYEPCVGQFTQKNEKFFSCWLSPVSLDIAEDHEHLAGVIKNIKKQIKRAYPEALNELKNEKILIKNDIGGHISLGEQPWQPFSSLKNLFNCHSQNLPSEGAFAKICAAQSFCQWAEDEWAMNSATSTLIAENSPTIPAS